MLQVSRGWLRVTTILNQSFGPRVLVNHGSPTYDLHFTNYIIHEHPALAAYFPILPFDCGRQPNMSHETDLELLHAPSKSTANAYRPVDIFPPDIYYRGTEMPIKALERSISKETMESYYGRRWAIGLKAMRLIQQRDNTDNEWAEKDGELKELQLQVDRLKNRKKSNFNSRIQTQSWTAYAVHCSQKKLPRCGGHLCSSLVAASVNYPANSKT